MADTNESQEIKELVSSLIKSASRKTKDGIYDEAAELLDQAVELDPKSVPALDLLGFVRWSLGDVKGAEEICRASLAIKPLGAYARKGLGVCLAGQGKVDEGISELHHAMALKPTWIDPVHDLVVVLFNAKRYKQAIPMIERCLEMEPSLSKKLGPLLEKSRKALEEAAE